MTPPADINRRRFLTGVAGGATLAGLPAGMAEAAAEPRKRGSLDDVEHVVVLMQENRSFDHYYGTLRGVRGFSDKSALTGVFRQPDPKRTDGGYLLPFHVDTWQVDGQQLADLDHSWDGTHAAWAGGNYNGWVAAKTELTMSYFTDSDIRYHHALADAFTICDNYFCSIQGPTTPNRLFLFTGTIDPEGRAGGPAINNPADYNPVYNWTTYPERLQAAGIPWKVYANKEVGDGGGEDGWVGDYGDNPLWLFQAYHDALASPDPAKRQLAERASVHDGWLPNSGQGHDPNHVLAEFIADCRAGTLPRVSFVVAPYAYCEHPRARPVDGARYVDTMLQALFANEKLWNSTAVFLNYDENDGFFDHVLPPVPAPGTPLEFVGGRPIGFGPRVPMTVISPWSRGGWVNSQVTDHTSVIRFLERWTGVREPNISPWRRAIAGDLTGAFDFREHDTKIPMLPDTAAMQREVDKVEPSLPTPAPPSVGAQEMPVQEPGTRPARALPYQVLANASTAAGSFKVEMSNSGAGAVQLSLHPKGLLPSTYFVDADGKATASVLSDDIALYGPNGFLRSFTGHGPVEVSLVLQGTSPRLTIANSGARAAEVTIATRKITVPAGSSHVEDVRTAQGWYDVTVTASGGFSRRFAGRVEDGSPGVTG
ncbi:phosphocholine-specific phospholipase C [Amycolatopsis sp.]|uniref:phosphocholine-specific phospholipase C n=1 Tax=Amycolatopsis sp. TaxID=37632 RepID=UPI002C7EEEFC|nr:phospholipase C, phosphocholine-specific [Amycolatopsis sp.]HVV11693.1 phospholipase C, phosphocholine-specific [Amycolatopsis sp.]